MPAQQFRVDEAIFHRKQKTGQSGDAARDDKSRQLVGVGGKTGGAHALFVGLDARQSTAKARAQQHGQKTEHGQQAGQGEAINGERLVQVQQRAQHRFGQQVNAVRATAQGGVVQHVIGHLRKRQRDHDEVHALGAQRQGADQQRVTGGGQHTQGQQPQHRGRAVLRGQQHSGVGPHAKERSLAKAHQTGAAHEQLQAERQHGVNHDFGDEVQRVSARHKGQHGQGGKNQGDKKGFGMAHQFTPP